MYCTLFLAGEEIQLFFNLQRGSLYLYYSLCNFNLLSGGQVGLNVHYIPRYPDKTFLQIRVQ